MTTLIDVLDTSVKIGLGALISGLATYWVTRSKNKHELKIIHLEDKRHLLREISENLEASSGLINIFSHSLSQALAENNEDRLKDDVKSLLKAYNLQGKAHSLAYLVSEEELADAINGLSEVALEFHEYILDGSFPADFEKANSLLERMNKMNGIITPLLSKAYAQLAIYS